MRKFKKLNITQHTESSSNLQTSSIQSEGYVSFIANTLYPHKLKYQDFLKLPDLESTQRSSISMIKLFPLKKLTPKNKLNLSKSRTLL